MKEDFGQGRIKNSNSQEGYEICMRGNFCPDFHMKQENRNEASGTPQSWM